MVETPALTVTFVAKFFGKTACVEVWTTFAMLMNQTAIGKGWTIFRIQLRRRAVSDDMRDSRQEVMRVWRTTWNIDNRFAR